MSQSQRFDSRYEEPLPRPPAPGLGAARPVRPPSVPAESRSGLVVARDPRAATLILTVGLPGAGKTTRAKNCRDAPGAAADPGSLDDPAVRRFDGRRQALGLEGRLISVALQALRLGHPCRARLRVWDRDERSALRWLAQSAGPACQVVYLPVDKDVQLARVAHRQATAPHQTFPISEAELDQWRRSSRS